MLHRLPPGGGLHWRAGDPHPGGQGAAEVRLQGRQGDRAEEHRRDQLASREGVQLGLSE